jgi:RNA polymerase sigma factor (sigma-70 family)
MMATTGPDDGLIAELFVQAERTAIRLVGRDRAEDIASEAVVRALSRWSKVCDYPHAWVTRVATNLAIDLLRRHGPPTSGTTVGVQSSFEDDTVRRMDIAAALGHLSRRQQEVVVLHHLAGFSDGQVSEALGMSLPTVKTHLGRAMTRLRRLDRAPTENSDASTDSA